MAKNREITSVTKKVEVYDILLTGRTNWAV